ncbi:unnamed protein product, partial [Ilex paraguariensis]
KNRKKSSLTSVMATPPRSLNFLIFILIFTKLLAIAQDDDTQFMYHGFRDSKLYIDGQAVIRPNGLLRLTNTSDGETGHAFYPNPVRFNSSSSSGSAQSLSFSTYFVFAITTDFDIPKGHGFAFVISPSLTFTQRGLTNQFLGIFNSTNNGLASNHVFAIEFDTMKNPDFDDIDGNHVGIDINSLISNISVTVTYFSNTEGVNKTLDLTSKTPTQVWIDYDGVKKNLVVTLAPVRIAKPNRPLLNVSIDLSPILFDYMYVGFSAAAGAAKLTGSNHYILGWSFNKTGPAQILDVSILPPVPGVMITKGTLVRDVTISVAVVLVVLIITTGGIAYIKHRRKYAEVREDWEVEYGPQRFSYKDLYKATKGFNHKELLGAGGFGQVFRGILSSSNAQVAVKRVSHESNQGMREFVAEIASMGRLRHRNLVALLGYCRRKGELLLVYDCMPHGSLDKFLHSNEKPSLNWAQRYQILRGIASGLLYLHEGWEKVVLHRDVKASNVLLDADFNGRLGDFGLARLYDHGENPKTTHVVGTFGYIAPELAKTGKATTSTDVFAFAAFMLEVACGQRPLKVHGFDDKILVQWVLEKWQEGAILEASDPRLRGEFVAEEMELVLKLGLLCSHYNPVSRPSMRQVMQYLDGDAMFSEVFIDDAGIGMAALMGNGISNEFAMTFPSSSSENISANALSGTESLLYMGR